MSLSVCLITADPAPRIATILEPLKPYADEIVIAADRRVERHTLAGYAAIADKLFRIEYRAIERHMAWLFAQCDGDWILRLDGDEVPSSAFVRALPGMLASRQVRQLWAPVRWIYPDARSFLGDDPWSVDFTGRLLRNDGTLRFRGIQHMHAEPTVPRGYVEEPFYHLDLLTSSEQQRREKAVRYEASRPGVRAVGGAPINEAFYLPELRKDLKLHAVPEEDLARIEAALTVAKPFEPSSVEQPTSEPRFVSLQEMDGLWEQRAVSEEAYRARIEPYHASVTLTPGESRALFLRVRNEGGERWPARLDEKPSIRIGHRWLNLDGGVYTEDGPRSPFMRAVAPGDRVLVPMDVVAPSKPGEYLIEADLVHEHVRWFGCGCRIAARVR